MSIVGFFSQKDLRAAQLEGLLVKTKMWQLKKGKNVMPFDEVFYKLDNKEIYFTAECTESSHVSQKWCSKDILYETPDAAYIAIYYNNTNVHTVEFQGFLLRTSTVEWKLQTSNGEDMPIGAAFKKLADRFVTISIDNMQLSNVSIINCNKTVIWP